MKSDDGFSNEIQFWDRELSLKGQFKEDILDRSDPTRYANVYPHFIDGYLKEISNQSRGLPRVLDVGSGPLSMLVYGNSKKEFSLYCVDPLADIYKKILKKYNYSISYPLINRPAEKLVEEFDEARFQLVWCRNALDHSQNPIEAFDQMARCVAPNGYLILQNFAMEGTTQRYHGLHQHDIYLEENNKLMLRSKIKDGTSLTARFDTNFPLVVVESTPPTKKPKDWIQIVWKKKMSVD